MRAVACPRRCWLIGDLAEAALRIGDLAEAALHAGRVRELDQQGQAITFQAVARRANVSRQWLYRQPELRAEIERLRVLHLERPDPVPARERSTQASLRQRVQTLLDANRRLRAENADLRGELAVAYGTDRARRTGGAIMR